MTDQEKNEHSGRLYALKLLGVDLLHERIRQLPDSCADKTWETGYVIRGYKIKMAAI